MTSFSNPTSRRNLLLTVSIVIFGGLLYTLYGILPVLANHIQHPEIITICLIIMVSLIVMLLWSLLGVFGGLAALLIAMVCLYKPFMELNSYYYGVLITAYFISSFIGYYVYRKISLANQEYTVTVERIREDANLVKNHLKNREAEVGAMGEKIVSLLKLKTIADNLSLSLSLEAIINIVSEETFHLFGPEEDKRILLFMVDANKKEITLFHTIKGPKRSPFASKNGGIFDRWTLKNMKSLLVKDVKKDFRFAVGGKELADDAVSIMIKPLMVESNILGMLRVDSTKESEFEQYELRILDIIGELAAVAMENARLYRQTEELAIKDSLTELYVHRYFMERVEEEVKRAVRSNSSFALIMFDIDDFKGFNDKYGHIAGDVVLKNIGHILQSKASAGDIVARYGGEEFAFLALGYDRKRALELANDIIKEIEKTPVVIRREKCFVTSSAGVAVFPEDAKIKEEIIWAADKCLYEAKSKGKNIVCSK